MGCSASIYSDVVVRTGGNMSKRRSSTSTVTSVDAIESGEGYFGTISKRFGHPSYYKLDGYDLGLRYKVKGVMQSFFVGCSRKTGEKVTVKEFHLAHYPAGDNTIMNEVLFLSKLSHPGLPAFREVFITDNSIFVVTDYVEQHRLSNCMSSLSTADIRDIYRQVVQTVVYCHERKIVLRDLSPANIAIQMRGNGVYEAKIADLSLAVESSGVSVSALADHVLFDWSLVRYTSPEVLLSQPYTTSADMWSLGVLLYAMLTRGHKLPFEHPIDHVLVRQITQAQFDFECDEIWEEASCEKARQLIEQLLSVRTQDRSTAKDLLKNRWIQLGE